MLPSSGDGLRRQDFPHTRFRVDSEYSLTVRTGLSDPGQPVQIGRYRLSSQNDLRETIIHEELHHGWFERPQTYVRKHHPKPSEARNAAHLAQTDKFYEIVQRYMNIRGWNGSGKRK
ncbi:hypothetical protein [Streptomyces sp. CB01881]|uniref:hypothetical protein n=1 Tax=Streptomyces sp. CB01881 TaxID=2078691 RepID=UPI000CDCA364|nr:hypothetical protein [Streptomyces sp. CB01881]AUY53682.1 hypothetical protein C2142_38115 [Streptomyces sp. CB01881]